ncbi:TonB-dependent receptor [Gelidibacter maritimus]|uniref:TonB-dependent receptor n=1 Tax=Gelidibacter maritimus TaxID=2761487 RepID=A0A7W2M2X3_9FLAO|nr:TonB-dependent receptor [Gelidibacter maritimus]MBA6151747.1 TonB-dependent receptor [Gelidibacter maritimus]
MKSNFLFLLLTFYYLGSQAQIEVTGTIIDAETKKNLGSTSIVVSPKGKSNILGYAISDSEGKFKIKITTTVDSLSLKVSSLAYIPFKKDILTKNQDITVLLEPAIETLDEIFLRKPPIRQRGDTLIFDPAAFKSNKDRSIQDVLSKMPGIDIDPSGAIKYQGKPINKFYVEGLDLMGGQYGMVSNNLNADKVSAVEILENHQPLKVLDSLVPSEQAAINIKLKNKVTVSGNIEMGLGAAPTLYFGKASPMLFTKNFQTLVTYQANNNGTDITQDFSRFSYTSFRFGRSGDTKNDWLSLASVNPPPFSKKRWLDNQAQAASTNALVKNKKDVEFKVNASYINNLIKKEGGHRTTYFLPEGNTTIENLTENNTRDESMDVSLSIERNKNKNLFRESLSFKKEWDRGSAFLTENQDSQYQRLSAPFTDLKNNFEIIFPLGKQLITFNSNIQYHETPQELSISPGVFTEILSPNQPVDEVNQQLFDKTFIANHSLDFTKRFGNFSLSLQPGVDFKLQNMHSQILLDGIPKSDPDFKNDMKWREVSTYARTGLNYRTDKLRISLRLPFEITHYEIDDQVTNKNQTKNPFTLNPSLWSEYKFWNYWKTNVSARYSKNYGPLNETYSGYLLSYYRNLARHNVPLMERSSQSISFGLEYRNPINTWFGRINFSYSDGKNDQIFNMITQPNGSTVVEALDLINKDNRKSLGASASKLISPIKTTFKLNSNYTYSNRDILLNGELMKNTTESWQNSINLNGDFVNWMTIEYDGSVRLSQTENTIQDLRRVRNQNHKLGLYFYFLKHHTLSFSGEWVQSKLENDSWDDFFGDILYRFTLSEKRKIDFELSLINLFNKNIYQNISVGDYTITESKYVLRPRQVMAKVRIPL